MNDLKVRELTRGDKVSEAFPLENIVFILMGCVSYEGSDPLEAFRNGEDAEKRESELDKMSYKEKEKIGYATYDTFSVVQLPIEGE